MRDTAQDQAEGGGRFALARAGMDDDQALLAALLRHHAVARGLLLSHFGGVPDVFGNILFGSHAQHSFGLTRRSSGQMVAPMLVPVLRQAKRECDRVQGLESPSAPEAAAPATVTGEILRRH